MLAPNRPRVLLCNEPLSYREALLFALKRLRPAIEFVSVAPNEVRDTLIHAVPDLVISSEASLMENASWPWILLYPDGARLAVVRTNTHQELFNNFGLNDLLNVMDRLL